MEEKTETAGYTEMLVCIHKITYCHNPIDRNLNFHFHENLRSHTCIDFVGLEVLKNVERPGFLGDNLAKSMHILFD
jgi:hypothetical protein